MQSDQSEPRVKHRWCFSQCDCMCNTFTQPLLHFPTHRSSNSHLHILVYFFCLISQLPPSPPITASLLLHHLHSPHSTLSFCRFLLRNSLHLSRRAEMLSAELINFAWCETEDGFPGRLGGFSSLEPF